MAAEGRVGTMLRIENEPTAVKENGREKARYEHKELINILK